MVASVYIKDGNIHFYNEKSSLSNIGGLAYELGRPLLDFLCYEPEQFDEGFSMIAETFDDVYAHIGAKTPEFLAGLRQVMGELQQQEIYISFYNQILMDFALTFIDNPQQAVSLFSAKILDKSGKLNWTQEFRWPKSSTPYPDDDKHLFRAVKDAVALLSEDIREKQSSMISEINLLLNFREAKGQPKKSPLEYLYWMEEYRRETTGYYFYLENPLRTFYSAVPSHEIVQLYEVDSIDDLFRFEFIQMIEQDIFIKKCKNCGRFFIPRGRADAGYCNRIYGDTGRKCSEIGATLRYERKVAENPILEAHKKAYRRFNSRVRTKKMTQAEFLRWSEEAREKRDACLAGELSFEDFTAWLEQGRIRKSRGGSKATTAQKQEHSDA